MERVVYPRRAGVEEPPMLEACCQVFLWIKGRRVKGDLAHLVWCPMDSHFRACGGDGLGFPFGDKERGGGGNGAVDSSVHGVPPLGGAAPGSPSPPQSSAICELPS